MALCFIMFLSTLLYPVVTGNGFFSGEDQGLQSYGFSEKSGRIEMLVVMAPDTWTTTRSSCSVMSCRSVFLQYICIVCVGIF